MADKINFAVLGCGHIGRRHIEMIMRNEHCILSAVADVDVSQVPDLTESVARFSSLGDMLESGKNIDVVVVATPNGLHFQQAMQVLRSGRHVVVEKPLALDSAQAARLVAEAQDRKLHIFPVVQNRYSPPVQWLREILKSGLLGKVFMVQMNCFWNRDARYYTPGSWRGTADMDGGTLYTQFSHFIDILYWLFGDISDINAKMSDFMHASLTDFEDSGIITFNIEGGGMGSLNFTTAVWDSNLESALTIIAEQGSVRIGGQYMDAVEVCHIKKYSLPKLRPTNPANDYGVYRGSAANHHFVVEEVVRVLRHGERPAIAAEDGAAVVDLIERMYAEAAEPRAVRKI